MNLFHVLRRAVRERVAALAREAERAIDEAQLDKLSVEPPRDPNHGDVATNAALVLAKPWRDKPMAIAGRLAERLAEAPEVAEASAAPPGFVNLRLERAFLADVAAAARAAGPDWGRSDLGAGRSANVEFCSANPTGPVHVGHARGTVFGDALAGLLDFAGWKVTREYYVNDAGGQIDALARSVHHRYLEALGRRPGPMAEGLYPGAYLEPVGRELAERDGERWAEAAEREWLEPLRRFAVDEMLALIRADLGRLGVRFDRFSSEREMVESGAVAAAIADLERRDLVYEGALPPPKGKPDADWEPRVQKLFRSTAFGDDVDRALAKSDGSATYFANDIAYHWDKAERGAELMIDVLGADHGGYLERMKAAVAAHPSERAIRFEIRFCQMVNFLDAGQPLKMSKRAGRFVTVADVVEEVGADALRFMMLTRKNEAPLDFDLVKVTEQSKDNPVFYVQYAHARICSVFRQANELSIEIDPGLNAAQAISRLDHPAEWAALTKALEFPRVIEQAAVHLEPHRIAFYLIDLAAVLHALWTKGKEDTTLRFIQADDRDGTIARLTLLAILRDTLANGLSALGVTPVAELR